MAMTTPTEERISPIPEGFHTVTPTLIVDGAAAAIEFYVRAFGAEELGRAATPDGQKIMHAMIQIGDSRLMLGDEFPEMGCRGPRTIGGTPVSLHLYVEDADAFYEQAVAAGAQATMPICDAFWGDRYARLLDPFGHDWAIASRQRVVGEAELEKAAQECMS
jgi:uncharacterized glyoxalase superfamily protein PhnB